MYKSPIVNINIGKNYGQLPRECEIAVVCNLLEKERAIVGGSNFGHEPRTDDETKTFYTDRSVSYLPPITTLHQGFVEWNNSGAPNSATSATNGGSNTTNQKSAVANTPFTLLSGNPQPQTILKVGPTSIGNSMFVVPQPNSLSNTNNAAIPFNPKSPTGNFVPAGGMFGGAGAGG